MKKLALSLFKSNADLLDYSRRVSRLQSTQSRRSAVKIAVIDDDAFLPHTNLQSYGYVIEQIGDIKNINEVERFDIVLCDIIGVGRHFDNSSQGASIITEIKNEYPEKVVVAYTGGTPSEKAIRLVSEKADSVIKKDIDIQDWVGKLDAVLEGAVDPHIIWNKVRTRFVELARLIHEAPVLVCSGFD